LSILNKEQRGFLTPDEFNKFAKQAQLSLLDAAFSEYNLMTTFDQVQRTHLGYADMPSKIKEKIDNWILDRRLKKKIKELRKRDPFIYK